MGAVRLRRRAVVVLIVVFRRRRVDLASGGFVDLMDFAIGMSVSEMKGQYAADVSGARRRNRSTTEVKRMQQNLREEARSPSSACSRSSRSCATPVRTRRSRRSRKRRAGSDREESERERETESKTAVIPRRGTRAVVAVRGPEVDVVLTSVVVRTTVH
jgi:hypothetical protein